MTYSKSILCGLLAISCSLPACQRSNSEASATPTGITINQTSYTQDNIGEVREGSSVFQTAIQASQEATPTYVTVYFQEKIQPRGGLDLIPSYITVSHDGSTRQGKWTGGTARTSSYQNGRPTLLFDQCRFEGDITLTGTFVYRQKSNEPEEIFLWPDGDPFAQWLSGEPYWDGNNLGNIQNPQIIVYRPDIQTAPAPAVLICPGGSYKTVATYHEGSLVAQWFKEQGFVAAVLYYAFPSGHPEIPLSDAQQGIRYLKESHLLEDVYTFNDFSYHGGNPGCLPRDEVTSRRDAGNLINEFNGHKFHTKPCDCESHRLAHALRHARVVSDAAQQPGISGTIGWCMFDYNTHQEFGSGDRICYHGVMDMFRNPKLAAALYRSQQEEEPVLEVSSSMDLGEYPGGMLKTVGVFTNGDWVDLYRNDLFIGSYFPAEKY